ncbi:MAG: O-antigen ligase domain-containing protein [Actinomycetota bacterium]|nr:O-antigen ligase domain-containing protein [Actinomycetota bacterium]
MSISQGAGLRVRRRATGATDQGRTGIPTLILAVWAALFFNVLAFSAFPTVVPIPHSVGQMLTQGSLIAALLFALVVNPRVVLRPNLFLVLMTMLSIVALMTSIHNQFVIGSTFRATRLAVFLCVLWLLTPWWGRRDMLLLRCHLRCLWFALATVVVGALLAPGKAFSFGGRLSGALWPMPPTQVAHYAAMLFGISAVLWMCRVLTGRRALLALVASGCILVGTHTRTALIAMLVGLLVAGASLFLGHARVRHTSALGAVFAVLAATLFAPDVTAWARRGQSLQEAAQLTGRTKVWSAVFDTPRPRINELFGSGLSNQSFNGLPIDSNWVAAYLDQGWFGLIVEASILLLLLAMAATHVRGPQRAVALFIVLYCIVASITETGLGTASPYLLDLTVAALLLAPEARRRRR